MFDKLKQLTKDTAIYGISTIVGRFLTFLLVPFYTHVFTTKDFGVYSNLYIFIAVFNVVLIYGMDAAFLKFASVPVIGDDKDNFSTPFLSVFSVALVLTSVLMLLKAPIYWLLDVPSDFYYLIYLAGPILFFDAISVLPFIKLRLEHKAKKFATFKVINIVVNVFLNLFLILKLKWGIEAVFVSNLVASAVSFLLLFPSILKSFRFKINKILLRRLLKFGLPYFPAGLAAMLIQGIDRPILTHLTDLSTSGLYSANYKLGIFMLLFVNMFQYAWQPFFLQNAEEKNAKEIFAKVLTYFTLVASIILVVLSLFISDLAQFRILGHSVIGKAYLSGLNIVPIILFAYLFNGLYVIFTAGIYIKEKSLYVPMMTGIGATVNIVLCIILIPILNIMGAALATLAAYLVMSIGYYIVTQKFYRIEYEFAKIGKIFISISIVGIIYYVQIFGGYISLLNKFLMLLLFFILLGIFNIGKEEIMFLRKRFLNAKNKS
jgi:O-antigen/teichoic acid export membrane protein